MALLESKLITTLGPKKAGELGMILPHEHVFLESRRWDQFGYAQAETTCVIDLMSPEIEKAQVAGVTTIVEASAVGMGRRADILKAVSEATHLPLVIPTGVFQEPWIPDWVHSANEGELREWMISELLGEIEESGVQAGWIKLGASDDGLAVCETKVLRAAAAAGMVTNSVIGSHTIQGQVVQEQLGIVEEVGHSPERFIWIHAHAEPDFDLHLKVAQRGAWIEYDLIGREGMDDGFFIEHIRRMLDAGLGDRLLLSHDRGWYDPGQPGGGTPRPYTYICKHFLPKLQAAGVTPETIWQLTHTNPFQAFAR